MKKGYICISIAIVFIFLVFRTIVIAEVTTRRPLSEPGDEERATVTTRKIVDSTESQSIPKNTPFPQMGQNADKPGAYEMVIRAGSMMINPGDTLQVDIFFTGYGFIQSAKMGFYPPSDFIDKSGGSYVLHSLKEHGSGYIFGALKDKVEDYGVTLTMQGLQVGSWASPTQFFDLQRPNGNFAQLISTEVVLNNPPVRFVLHSMKKGCRSGEHNLCFIFTYFNGSEWKTSSNSISIEVTSWYKRHEVILWIIGVVLAVILALLKEILSWLFRAIIKPAYAKVKEFRSWLFRAITPAKRRNKKGKK